MRISDWSSDVCSSDLERIGLGLEARAVAEQDHVIIHRHRIVGEMAVVRVMLADLLDQGPKHPERAVRAAFLLQQLQADLPFVLHAAMQIGSASCRERGWQYVEISVVAGLLKKN